MASFKVTHKDAITPKEVEITDSMTLGDYRLYLRGLTPKQRASLELFGDPEWTTKKGCTDDQFYTTQWGGHVTIEEIERYYGRRD